jgi:TonB family protein
MYLIRIGKTEVKPKKSPKKIMVGAAVIVLLAATFFVFNYFSGKNNEQIAQQTRSAAVNEPKPAQNSTIEKENQTSPVSTKIPTVQHDDPIEPNISAKETSKKQDTIISNQGYGGDRTWTHFVSINIKYPDSAKTDTITGTAIVNFTINEQGHPVDFIRKTKLGHGLEDELIRVIQLAKWKPYKLNNIARSSSYTVTYKFVLPVDQNIKKPNVNPDTQKENQPKEDQQKGQN